MSFNLNKFDISSENFDLFFEDAISTMNEHQKSELPRELYFKMFLRTGEVNIEACRRMKYVEKVYALWKGKGYEITINIRGKNGEGMSVDEYCQLQKTESSREEDPDDIEKGIYKAHAFFVTVDDEMADILAKAGTDFHSPKYRLFLKAKNNRDLPIHKSTEFRQQMKYIVRLFMFYEANKKHWAVKDEISTISEWYVLILLYPGDEIVGSKIHKEIYKYAFSTAQSAIKAAYGTLQAKKFIIKRGYKKGATFRITTLGKEVVNKIMKKYVLDF